MKIVNYLMMLLLAFSLAAPAQKSCAGEGCEEGGRGQHESSRYR